MEWPGASSFGPDFQSELSRRLMDARTLVVNQPISNAVAGQVAEQLAVMDAESSRPLLVMISNAPGGSVEAALSVFDLLRSMAAPVSVVATGRVAGAGVLVFLGVDRDARFALPHARFQLDEPEGALSGRGQTLEQEAQDVAFLTRRVVDLVTAATGQPREQVARDLQRRRRFDADAAVEYGLVARVVQSVREVKP